MSKESPPWNWPNPPFGIVLVEPEIPPNTGNIARTCGATGSVLHLIKPLGFSLSEKAVRRAGLDYWEHVDIHVHDSWEAFLHTHGDQRMFFFSTKTSTPYTDATFLPGDLLVFGPETRGLPKELLASNPTQVLTLPMQEGKVRSLNLATTAGTVLYEALRQQQI